MSRRSIAAVVSCMALSLLALGVGPGWASAAGSIDPSYGMSGTATVTDPAGVSGDAAVTLPDGSVVTAGRAGQEAPFSIVTNKVSPDGVIDPDPNTSGYNPNGIGRSAGDDVTIRSMAAAPGNKVVLVGATDDGSGNRQWLVMRITPVGYLDHNFGVGGIVRLSMPGDASANVVAAYPDGSVLVGGSTVGLAPYPDQLAFVRLDSSGNPDPAFGQGGVETLPYPGSVGQDLVVRPDGSFVVGGWVEDGSGTHSVAASFLVNGHADTAWGIDGVVTVPNSDVHALALEAGGGLVLAGQVQGPGGWGTGVIRLDATGALDGSFGVGGVTPPIEPPDTRSAADVIVQDDGRIVVAGTATGPIGDGVFAVARFTADGQLDPTFGNDGLITRDVHPGQESRAFMLATQPSGNVVVAGESNDTSDHLMTIVSRYFVDDAPTTSIDSGPSGPVATPDASFTFSSSIASATFSCSLDGTAFTTCSSPASFLGLHDGDHTFRVRATDTANNIGPAAVAHFTVDTRAPVTTIDSGPAGTVYSSHQRFTFSASEPSTFECSLDVGDFIPCGSPTVLGGLTDGSHAFRVRAVDAAGNRSAPAGAAFRVDTSDVLRPDAMIDTDTGVWTGDNVFNQTGSKQKATLKLEPGTVATYEVALQNDGTLPDVLRARAHASIPGCTVRYLADGVNVSRQVAAGTFSTARLAPGESAVLIIQVHVHRAARLGPRPSDRLVTASKRDGRVRDAVLARVVIVHVAV